MNNHPTNKMGESEEVENTRGLFTLYIAAQIVGLFSVLLTLYWCIAFNSGFGLSSSPLFNWHPLFMSIGLIYLMGNGILVFRVFRNSDKRTLKLMHATINGAGFVFTALATLAVIANHNESGSANFYTLHGWIGIIAVALYFGQAVSGLCVYLLDMSSVVKKVSFMPYHVYIGHLIFVLGIASALIGLDEKAIWSLGDDYEARIPAAWLMNFMGVIFVVFGALVVFMSSNPLYKRYPRAEDSELLGRNSNQI